MVGIDLSDVLELIQLAVRIAEKVGATTVELDTTETEAIAEGAARLIEMYGPPVPPAS